MKHGRNKKFCEKYRNEGRREKNKALKAEREKRKRLNRIAKHDRRLKREVA